jgi:hypothetical protein
MEKIIKNLVIEYFLNSSKYEFKDFDMNDVMADLQPLINATIEQYLYIKKNENDTNIMFF